MDKNIGKTLANIWVNAGYDTLGKLHKATGITVATLSRIKNNIQKPTPETLEKLAPALRMSHSDLLKIAGYISDDNQPPTIPTHKEEKKPQDLKKILEHHEIMFDGVPIDDEAKEDILHIVEFELYKRAKEMNKRKPKPNNKENELNPKRTKKHDTK